MKTRIGDVDDLLWQVMPAARDLEELINLTESDQKLNISADGVAMAVEDVAVKMIMMRCSFSR
jgi:hypothetical protein